MLGVWLVAMIAYQVLGRLPAKNAQSSYLAQTVVAEAKAQEVTRAAVKAQLPVAYQLNEQETVKLERATQAMIRPPDPGGGLGTAKQGAGKPTQEAAAELKQQP